MGLASISVGLWGHQFSEVAFRISRIYGEGCGWIMAWDTNLCPNIFKRILAILNFLGFGWGGMGGVSDVKILHF